MKPCFGSLLAVEWLSPEILIDTIPDGIMAVDLQGCICAWNLVMRNLTGYSPDEVCGRLCSLIGCSDCQEMGYSPEHCPLLRGELEKLTMECELLCADGSRIPVLKNAGVVRDKKGRIQGVLASFSDLRKVRRLEKELAVLAQYSGVDMQGLIGQSQSMREVYRRIRLTADSDVTVLLLGETGTGKERVAEAIHRESNRSSGPLVRVNCSALPETLLESELFGHVKGAFTGATRDKPGRFELANGGTIFLDEIGDISPLIQLKLLRILEDRSFERVGDSETRRADFRVICATHRDLRQMVRDGQFREDLFYRIQVFPIMIPPLRERKSDIPLLLQHFIGIFNRAGGHHIQGVDNDALLCLMDHCWPGNVRELENALEHAFVTCRTGLIGLFDLPMEIRMVELRNAHCLEKRISSTAVYQQSLPPESVPENSLTDPDLFRQQLASCGNNRSRLARKLNVDRTTIWRKMKQFNIL